MEKLSLDLILMITDLLDVKCDTLALAATCKSLRVTLRAVIYRHLNLRFDDDNPAISVLQQFMLHGQHIVPYVRSVTLLAVPDMMDGYCHFLHSLERSAEDDDAEFDCPEHPPDISSHALAEMLSVIPDNMLESFRWDIDSCVPVYVRHFLQRQAGTLIELSVSIKKYCTALQKHIAAVLAIPMSSLRTLNWRGLPDMLREPTHRDTPGKYDTMHIQDVALLTVKSFDCLDQSHEKSDQRHLSQHECEIVLKPVHVSLRTSMTELHCGVFDVDFSDLQSLSLPLQSIHDEFDSLWTDSITMDGYGPSMKQLRLFNLSSELENVENAVALINEAPDLESLSLSFQDWGSLMEFHEYNFLIGERLQRLVIHNDTLVKVDQADRMGSWWSEVLRDVLIGSNIRILDVNANPDAMARVFRSPIDIKLELLRVSHWRWPRDRSSQYSTCSIPSLKCRVKRLRKKISRAQCDTPELTPSQEMAALYRLAQQLFAPSGFPTLRVLVGDLWTARHAAHSMEVYCRKPTHHSAVSSAQAQSDSHDCRIYARNLEAHDSEEIALINANFDLFEAASPYLQDYGAIVS